MLKIILNNVVFVEFTFHLSHTWVEAGRRTKMGQVGTAINEWMQMNGIMSRHSLGINELADHQWHCIRKQKHNIFHHTKRYVYTKLVFFCKLYVFLLRVVQKPAIQRFHGIREHRNSIVVSGYYSLENYLKLNLWKKKYIYVIYAQEDDFLQ